MKKVLIILLSLVAFTLQAKSYDRNWGRDLKLPSQHLLEKITISSPALASTSLIFGINANDGDTTGVVTTVTTGITNPDVPRTLVVNTVESTAGDILPGFVTITGTNIFNAVISEAFSIAYDQTLAKTGTKAFKTITSIQFPIEGGSYGAKWWVGTTDALGLDKCIAVAGDIGWAHLDGAFETTDPTCVADADEVEKNTCDINGTLNDSKDVVIYFIQNFRCLP